MEIYRVIWGNGTSKWLSSTQTSSLCRLNYMLEHSNRHSVDPQFMITQRQQLAFASQIAQGLVGYSNFIPSSFQNKKKIEKWKVWISGIHLPTGLRSSRYRRKEYSRWRFRYVQDWRFWTVSRSGKSARALSIHGELFPSLSIGISYWIVTIYLVRVVGCPFVGCHRRLSSHHSFLQRVMCELQTIFSSIMPPPRCF